MKKATLKTAGTAVLGVACVAAAAGTAFAAPALPGGAEPLDAGSTVAGAARALPLLQPTAGATGGLNPAVGARVAAQGVRTVQPVLTGVADAAEYIADQGRPQASKTRAGEPGSVALAPTSHGNSFGGPVGEVLGGLSGGGLLGLGG